MSDTERAVLIKVSSQLTNSSDVARKSFSPSCGDSGLHREGWETLKEMGALPGWDALPSNAQRWPVSALPQGYTTVQPADSKAETVWSKLHLR